VKVSDKLLGEYAGYYDKEGLSSKRTLAAAQSVAHLRALAPTPVGSLLDIGAGEGAVLSELSRSGFARDLHAVEISESGLASIEQRQIPNLRSARKFDGYSIDAADSQYDFGTAIHVLEHVEHERAFLAEVTRVCRTAYIEVPLEMTLRVGKSILASGPFGHINFYNPATFLNLVETCGLEVLGFRVFANSLPYERHVSGRVGGSIKYAIRSGLLSALPKAAPYFMTYLAGVVCRRKDAPASVQPGAAP
jgi:hypothetical protein